MQIIEFPASRRRHPLPTDDDIAVFAKYIIPLLDDLFSATPTTIDGVIGIAEYCRVTIPYYGSLKTPWGGRCIVRSTSWPSSALRSVACSAWQGPRLRNQICRHSLWAIDSAGFVMATALLALKYFLSRNDIVAGGFLVFAIGDGVLLSGTAAGPAGSIPSFAAGTTLWATAPTAH